MHEFDPALRSRIRQLQVIALALIAGLVIFLGIVIGLVQSRGQGVNPPEGTPILSYVAVAFLSVEVLLWLIVPAQLARGQVVKIAAGTWRPAGPNVKPGQFESDVDKLLAVQQATTIIGMALLEGVGFVGCIAHLMEGEWLGVAVAGIVLVSMLATFPTFAGVAAWLERQQATIDELRQRHL